MGFEDWLFRERDSFFGCKRGEMDDCVWEEGVGVWLFGVGR